MKGDLATLEIGAATEGAEMPRPPICGRCYATGVDLFPANCAEDPQALVGAPIGMYHCPCCGAMVVAGVPHPQMCGLCIARKHPGFDDEPIVTDEVVSEED